eukprot:1161662-Pelagomonas_calceolata.AAC.1
MPDAFKPICALFLMQTQVNEAVDFSVKAIETAVAPLEEVTAEEVARLEVSSSGLGGVVYEGKEHLMLQSTSLIDDGKAMEAQRLVLIDAIRELQRQAANLDLNQVCTGINCAPRERAFFQLLFYWTATADQFWRIIPCTALHCAFINEHIGFAGCIAVPAYESSSKQKRRMAAVTNPSEGDQARALRGNSCLKTKGSIDVKKGKDYMAVPAYVGS